MSSTFKVSACTAEHIGDRSEQQDRVAILTHPRNPGVLLAIVADGMGGRTGGRMASDQVVATASHLLADLPLAQNSPRDLLKSIAAEAHTVIKLSAISSEKEPHSTFVALLLHKGNAVWAHAGDSRLYHFRAGKLVTRTGDHTYASQLAAAGKTTQAEIAQQKFKNILVSSLGIAREPQIDLGEADHLHAGDAFLLASDGLWAYFEDNELGSLLASVPPREASERLIKLARERAEGRGDNLSLAIVKLDPPDPPKRGL